jgi:hypothetical protein
MKKINIGFAAIVALLAMSFTIAAHSKVFRKRTDITNCYQTVTTANYMTVCAATPLFTPINCSNRLAALGQALKKDLTVSNYTVNTVTCNGTSNLCCINFKSTSTNPCPSDLHNSLKKGDGSLRDFNNNIIPTTSWVLVNDIQCKD